MELLEARWADGRSVCVGLDSELGKIPESVRANFPDPQFSIGAFNEDIVDATADLVCAYKPNLAFYLAHGIEGIGALQDTVHYIHKVAQDVPVILDSKWADIGNTNRGYAEFAFDLIGADAITVHPYLGQEALRPFLDRADKGIFVLARTSNPGSGEFQDLGVHTGNNLFGTVARQVSQFWNTNGNCGLVAGATYPEELETVRAFAPTLPLLIPGIGAQGGDVEKTVKAARNRFIVNSSRGIIFASREADFAAAARSATKLLHNDLVLYQSKG